MKSSGFTEMQDSSPTVESLDWLDVVRWTDDGLVPAIAQDATTGDILMMAWMNRESLALSCRGPSGVLVPFTG